MANLYQTYDLSLSLLLVIRQKEISTDVQSGIKRKPDGNLSEKIFQHGSYKTYGVVGKRNRNPWLGTMPLDADASALGLDSTRGTRMHCGNLGLSLSDIRYQTDSYGVHIQLPRKTHSSTEISELR